MFYAALMCWNEETFLLAEKGRPAANMRCPRPLPPGGGEGPQRGGEARGEGTVFVGRPPPAASRAREPERSRAKRREEPRVRLKKFPQKRAV